MTITRTWQIESLDCVPLIKGKTNVVSCVHWRVNATNNTNNASVYGTQSLTFDEKTLFTDYENITKDSVIGWVQESMGKEQVASLYTSLDNELDNLANPPVVSLPLPWANNA